MTLPFFAQETPDSCVPACLRMVMAHWGVQETEAILRAKCQTTHRGTNYHDAVACVQSYGLDAELITKASWFDLTSWLENNIYPIVSLNLYPIETRWSFHAVVIESVSETHVVYLDPLSGRKQANQTTFEQAWQMRRGKAMLITS